VSYTSGDPYRAEELVTFTVRLPREESFGPDWSRPSVRLAIGPVFTGDRRAVLHGAGCRLRRR